MVRHCVLPFLKCYQFFHIAHEQFMDGRPDFLISVTKEKIKMKSIPEDMQIYLRVFM